MNERTRQGQKLLKTKQLLETTLNSLQEAVFVVDPDERIIVLCNAAVASVFGYTPDELLGRSTEILHVDRASYERFSQLGAPILNRNEPFHIEYEMKRKDGAIIYTETTVTAISEESGWSTGVVSVIRDITARKEAEVALERQARRLEIVHQIDTAVLSADSPHDIAQTALVQIRQLLNCWRASLAVYNDDSEQPQLLAVSAEEESSIMPGEVVPSDQLWDATTLRRGEIYIEKDLTAMEGRSSLLRRLVDAGLQSYASVPLIVHGDLIGALNLAYDHRSGVDILDREVAREIANQLAIAIHQARLRKQLHALAGYLQEAREEERTRLARDIHDDLGQALTALKFDISRLQRALPEDASDLHKQAAQMSDSVESAIWLVRRVSSDLRPGILDDLGLAVAIEWHVNEFSRRTGIACTTDLHIGESVLPEKLSTALFRIYQEALTNVARHAQASRVHVSLHEHADAVVLTVRDNGTGITERHISNPDSLGLRGMRERARPWNGRITFEREPDAGTTVTVRIPNEF